MQQDIHTFKGMRRDNHPIRQSSDYLWEAHNIRFTNRDDNTLFAMTNEKGTKSTNISFQGQYVGHCVVGEYLIVFTVSGTTNYIYRVTKTNDTWSSTILYQGSLNMDSSHLAQTLGIYEGEFVQKVYWVDGINQPRVINVVEDKLLNKSLSSSMKEIYPEGCFNFTQDLTLKEKVTVTRKEGGGAFAPGVIQYAFSYYSKYGQESNLFYTTELYNTSYSTRGGSPEDVVANSFHIEIKNVETRFQYLRIYSIHRTTLDAIPSVKIVTDIELSGNTTITYVDTGLNGSDEDPTRMLYIGGESIIAGTITEKDNTLFLGNIELIRQSIPDSVKTALKAYVSNGKVTVSSRTLELDNVDNSEAIYEYSNQLSKDTPSTFKVGDTYRLGVQFQHKNGKWSEPSWIGNFEMPRTILPHRDGSNIILPTITFSLDTSIVTTLTNLGYKKARPLIVLPTTYDRMILAQGILCPTVFSVKDRVSNAPFAQSSWFFRPMSRDTVDNTADIEKGATVAFSHLSPLYSGSDRGAEIQNMVDTTFDVVNKEAKTVKGTNKNTFFVDQSIVTMHSPDIEFDTSTMQALEGNEFELDIVGVVNFKSNAGDISITTSSAVPAPSDTGFFHKSFTTTNYENKGMVAGLFYKSHIMDDTDNGESYEAFKPKDTTYEMNWLIYPWHRTGSLNNDCSRPDGKGTRTSVLKRKIISNLRFSPDTTWLDSVWSSEKKSDTDSKNGITPVSIFNSNEVSLIKIPTPKNSEIAALNYYGNVDSLVTTDTTYPFYFTANEGTNLNGIGSITNPFTQTPLVTLNGTLYNSLGGSSKIGSDTTALKFAKDPVRIKYKSTPHAVFAFNYMDNSSPVILPKLNNGINTYSGSTAVPFWSNIEDSSSGSSTVISSYKTAVIQISAISSSVTDVEAEIKSMLAAKSSGADYNTGDYAICVSVAMPSDSSYADLYVYTKEVDNNSWERVTLDASNVGDTYRIGLNTYYQVLKVDTNYLLHKLTIEESTQVYNIKQGIVSAGAAAKPCLYMAELKRKSKPDNMFGGDTEEALRNNLWIPAGDAVSIDSTLTFTHGDTYYQRYDCLKTYPFTDEDENSVIEIASFMCETRTNIDGRYDRNRGQLSNLTMSPLNFNLLNEVYTQKNNFFNYRILDKQFYRNTKYPTQVLWSLQKAYLEDTDTWTNVTLANSIELNGSAGVLTSLETYNTLVLAFQEKSLSQIMFNSQVQIPTSDNNPIEISNSYKVDGSRIISDAIGCQNKWSIIKSPQGVYFIDNITDTLYLYNGEMKDISTEVGIKYWMMENHPTDSFIRLSYDPKHKDLYMSPKDKEVLCFSEILGSATSLMSYNNAVMLPRNDEFLSLQYDTTNKVVKLWENFKGDYNTFFGNIVLPSFTYICNDNATYTKIFDTIEYRADIYDKNNSLQHNKSFDWIRAYNEYQDSGEKDLLQTRRTKDSETFKGINLSKKFRIWRGNVPRQGRERMRNPWTAINLGFKTSSTTDNNKFHFILHDISTKYTI